MQFSYYGNMTPLSSDIAEKDGVFKMMIEEFIQQSAKMLEKKFSKDLTANYKLINKNFSKQIASLKKTIGELKKKIEENKVDEKKIEEKK